FSNLGKKLSSAKTAREAGEIIVESADRLFGWDACTLDLYSEQNNRIHSVLNKDTIGGKRMDCVPTADNVQPSPRMRQVIEYGSQLILKEEPYELLPGSV